MARKKSDPNAIVGEHIFPNTRLTALALRWKELQTSGKTAEAMPLLEEIIIGSTRMFERFAQHENYHTTVDLPILVSAAQLLIPRWLTKWVPAKGKLFSWFSQCAKNAFRTELYRANQYGARYYTAGDNLETLFGSEDHQVDKHDMAEEMKKHINQITVRWGDPQEIGAIRYIVDCIMSEEHDKARTIRGACYAWGISPEMGKFFYRSALVILRTVLFEKAYMPFSEQDLFRQQHTYEPIVDLLDIISWPQLQKIIATMGGTRIKVPTISQMVRLREKHEVFTDISQSELDPETVKDIAKARKKSTKSAQEIFEEMCIVLDKKRSGEYPLYE